MSTRPASARIVSATTATAAASATSAAWAPPERLAAEGANFLGDFFGIPGRARDAGDIRAGGGEFQGDGASDAPSGTGHDGDLIGQFVHKLIVHNTTRQSVNGGGAECNKNFPCFYL
jgi:hypothetical protein